MSISLTIVIEGDGEIEFDMDIECESTFSILLEKISDFMGLEKDELVIVSPKGVMIDQILENVPNLKEVVLSRRSQTKNLEKKEDKKNKDINDLHIDFEKIVSSSQAKEVPKTSNNKLLLDKIPYDPFFSSIKFEFLHAVKGKIDSDLFKIILYHLSEESNRQYGLENHSPGPSLLDSIIPNITSSSSPKIQKISLEELFKLSINTRIPMICIYTYAPEDQSNNSSSSCLFDFIRYCFFESEMLRGILDNYLLFVITFF
jgi:hypothetical protein